MKPALFVTGHAPAERAAPFELLAHREQVEFALFGGRLRHGTGGASAPAIPHRRVRQRDVFALAASGRYRAVICGTAGRLALPAAYAGARRARLPFVLWASLWAHPRTPAHILGWPLARHVYSHADAVVTYGPHVSAYVRAHGARNVHVAPQSVDAGFWGASVPQEAVAATAAQWGDVGFRALFVGRAAREKGLRVLTGAWRASGLEPPVAALVLVGVEAGSSWPPADGAATPETRAARDPRPRAAGVRTAEEVRNFYAAADVLVVPSIPTPSFREPWGLVVNEAMTQGTAIIASDAVGAAAGGLVRDGETGLVVPAGERDALAAALRRLHGDEGLRERLVGAARARVATHTPEAWVTGFQAALRSVGASRER